MSEAGIITLAGAIRVVARELNAAEARAGSYATDPANYHTRHRDEMDRLATGLRQSVDARITDRWDGTRVRILGITSSSTTGTAGALHNWLHAARRRAEHGEPI